MKKRLILLLIALVLLIGVLTVSTSAATEVYSSSITATGTNIKWKLYSDGALEITGTGKIPDYDWDNGNGRANTPWHNIAASKGVNITSVTIGDGITQIGQRAFCGTTGLKEITIPGSVRTIGGWAFQRCTSLKTVILQEGVYSVGTAAFSSCDSLETVIINSSALQSVTGGCFGSCPSLKEFRVISTNPNFCTVDGVLYNKEMTILRRYPSGSTNTSFTVPETVTYIDESAFDGASHLVNVDMPSGVKTIGSSAFNRCTSLKSIVIPEGVTSLDYNAFYACHALESVTLPSTLRTIDTQAFYNCSYLSEITLPEGLRTIGTNAFNSNYQLKSIVIPSTVTKIDNYAFQNTNSLRKAVILNPNCTIGYTTFTCTMCGDSYEADEVDSLGHDYEEVVTTPTCTEGGYTVHTCRRCEDSFTDGETAALGHNFGEWEVVTPATGTSEGEEMRKCTGCGLEERRATEKLTHSFVDVPAGAFYENPVLWAVANGITSGTGDGSTFSPDMICTRAQVVTFLWRAAGSPEPTTTANPFTDIVEGSYYYKAVLWAVENEITSGTGNGTTFSPDMECTRAQVATFLWRTAGKPAAESSTHPFRDITAGSYYYDAVLWAVEAGVTNGTGDGSTFSSDKSCTRGEIVTFLYRALS